MMWEASWKHTENSCSHLQQALHLMVEMANSKTKPWVLPRISAYRFLTHKQASAKPASHVPPTRSSLRLQVNAGIESVWLTSAFVIVCAVVKLIFVCMWAAWMAMQGAKGPEAHSTVGRKPLMKKPAPLRNPLEPRPRFLKHLAISVLFRS